MSLALLFRSFRAEASCCVPVRGLPALADIVSGLRCRIVVRMLVTVVGESAGCFRAERVVFSGRSGSRLQTLFSAVLTICLPSPVPITFLAARCGEGCLERDVGS